MFVLLLKQIYCDLWSAFQNTSEHVNCKVIINKNLKKIGLNTGICMWEKVNLGFYFIFVSLYTIL